MFRKPKKGFEANQGELLPQAELQRMVSDSSALFNAAMTLKGLDPDSLREANILRAQEEERQRAERKEALGLQREQEERNLALLEVFGENVFTRVPRGYFAEDNAAFAHLYNNIAVIAQSNIAALTQSGYPFFIIGHNYSSGLLCADYLGGGEIFQLFPKTRKKEKYFTELAYGKISMNDPPFETSYVDSSHGFVFSPSTPTKRIVTVSNYDVDRKNTVTFGRYKQNSRESSETTPFLTDQTVRHFNMGIYLQRLAVILGKDEVLDSIGDLVNQKLVKNDQTRQEERDRTDRILDETIAWAEPIVKDVLEKMERDQQ